MVWLSGTVTAPDTVFAPYTRADSLAGYLLLMVPALFLGVWVCRRGSSPLWRTALVSVCALMTMATLGFALVSSARDLSNPVPIWLGTGKLIEKHPWLGVGPAQFRDAVSRFLLKPISLNTTTPQNSLLEITATGGLLALAAFLATLVLFFRRLRIKPSLRKSKGPKLTGEEPSTNDQEPRTPWECYLGGMFGLLIGFLLQALGRESDMVIHLAFLAGARSVVWFAAFALMEGIPWTDSIRSLATGLGLIALLVFLTVVGSVSFPSMAQSFWILAALTLNSVPSATCPGWKVPWYARAGALPFIVAVGFAFFLTTLQPVLSSAAATRRGLTAGRLYLDDRAKPALDRQIQLPKEFLEKNILQPLDAAASLDGGSTPQDVQPGQHDGGDARLHLYLAYWYAKHWELEPVKPEAITLAIWHAARVWQVIDPQGRDGYLAEYHLRTLLARKSQPLKAKRQYELAADVLIKLLDKAPSDPRLRFLLAEALFHAENKEEGKRHARAARELNADSLSAGLRLSAQQEHLINQWLDPTK
jgi:hypothetical protein